MNAWTALEFGPGESTFAFLDGPSGIIVSLESDPYWAEHWRKRILPHVGKNEWYLYPYENTAEVVVYGPWRKCTFDIALVDAPYGGNSARRVIHDNRPDLSRFNTLQWALEHAKVVLLHDADRPRERNSIRELGCTVTMLSERLGRVEA